MLNLLTPDLYVKRLADIPLNDLQNRGIRGLIVDLDNTVTEWNRPEVNLPARQWFQSLAPEFKVCLTSNNDRNRVMKVAEQLNIPFVCKAGKPRRRAFRSALKVLGTGTVDTAVIGDQIFTDVLGANRMGLYSILVIPLSKREFIGTRLMRRLERIVLRFIAAPGEGRCSRALPNYWE